VVGTRNAVQGSDGDGAIVLCDVESREGANWMCSLDGAFCTCMGVACEYDVMVACAICNSLLQSRSLSCGSAVWSRPSA
jgi:hypothetical protein